MAQPGYLGKKKVLEIQTEFSPWAFLANLAMPMNNINLRMEFVTSESASWLVHAGYMRGSISSYGIGFYGYEVSVLYPPATSSGSTQYLDPVGTLNFNSFEFGARRNWYFTGHGNLPPYGLYFSAGFGATIMHQNKNTLKYYDGKDKQVLFPVKDPGSVRALMGNLALGNRRMLSQDITLGWEIGMGLCLKQNSFASPLAEDVVNKDNAQIENHIMLRHYTNARVISVGLSLGWLLK
jgi:hypothetical protein